MRLLQLFLLLFFVLSAAPAAGQDHFPRSRKPIFILDSMRDEYKELNAFLEVAEDPAGRLSIGQVSAPDYDKNFKPFVQINKPLDADKTYWGRLRMSNNLMIDKEWILFVGIANYAEIYFPAKDHSWFKQKSGRLVPASEKSINLGRECVIPLVMKHFEKPITVYFRMQSVDNRSPVFSVSLQTRRKWDEDFLKRNIFQGIFHGALWILIIYHLAAFLLIRDLSYLYYTLYMTVASLYYLSVNGFLTETVLSEYPRLNEYTWIITVYSIGPFYFQFIRTFFNLKLSMPIWDRIIKYWLWLKVSLLAVFVGIVFFTFNIGTPNRIATVVGIIEPLLTFAFVIFWLKHRRTSATFIITGALLLNLFMMINLSYVALNHGAKNDTTLIQIGVTLEILFFAIGLGHREKQKEREKRRVQLQLIRQLRENERIKSHANRELEEKVQIRTAEISEKNEALEQQKKRIQDVNRILQSGRKELMSKNDELEQQKEEIAAQRDFIEQKNEELKYRSEKITDSIRYALTIQQAILPDERKLGSVLSEYFLIYEPKDIVAGDFYWLKEVDNAVLAATIDCTGHGVPGAFMSMIGNTLLNDIVGLEKIWDTARIMDELNNRIILSLRQDERANSDGMDAALCKIYRAEPDAETIKIEFTGAKRPLYYSFAENSELGELRGTNKSAGGYRRKKKRFESESAELPVGSMIYLTTDGLIDQNAPDREKFGTPKLKELLLSVRAESAEEQRRLISEALNAHRRGREQRDDITIFGIRLLPVSKKK